MIRRGTHHRRCRVSHGRSRQLRPCHLWLHHSGSGSTDAADGARKTRLSLNEWGSRNSSAGSAANAGSSHSSGVNGLGSGLFGRGWTLDSHGNDFFAAEEDEAECATVLALLVVVGFLSFSRRKLAELLAVAEDEIHVAVEGHKLADQLAAVLDCDPHPVVDVLEHL